LQLAPSALEHPQTTLRDPAYYQLYKRLYHFIEKFKDKLPSYTHEEVSAVTLKEQTELFTPYVQMSGIL
jgi:hypothetical protein